MDSIILNKKESSVSVIVSQYIELLMQSKNQCNSKSIKTIIDELWLNKKVVSIDSLSIDHDQLIY